MTVYERFGVKPIINVAGATTRHGGALMRQEVVEAMVEAAKVSVPLDELQAAASKVIARVTHAEAGIITCGAAAGLTLGTAACIAGLNVARMNRLPDTAGIPNEVIMPWHQICGYGHAIRAAGARLVGVGIPNDATPPQETHIISKWDIESAIVKDTVAIAYGARPGSHPPLQDVVEVAREHDIPVIVDAAAQVPPMENLYRFIDMGADLVCISGGKGIRGPQDSGILCGRRDLIASAALQMLDMAGKPFEAWNPPLSLIPKGKLHGKPEHGIGRGMKVTKEAAIGLLVALENFTDEGLAERKKSLRQLLGKIQQRLEGVAGLAMRVTGDSDGRYPLLELKIDQKVMGQSAYDVARKLNESTPSICIEDEDRLLSKGVVTIDSINLDEETSAIVGERLYAAIAS